MDFIDVSTHRITPFGLFNKTLSQPWRACLRLTDGFAQAECARAIANLPSLCVYTET